VDVSIAFQRIVYPSGRAPSASSENRIEAVEIRADELAIIDEIGYAAVLLRPQLFGQEPNIHARCIGTHDGDTITGLVEGNQQLKIRLGFIDSPELGQAFGYRAKAAAGKWKSEE
jgi:endonuclease YncB( thermonuclease family)